MSDPVLIVDRVARVATLTLNRPDAMNALSSALRDAIARAFRELEQDDAVRVAIVTGAGRAFCAGYDLKELASGATGATADSAASDMADAIAAFSGPIIGAINGHAITGGFELALACDVLIASREARFADTHARVGILPGWGLSQKLPRMIGISRAKEISLSGNFVDAEQALAWGLVNRVVAPLELLPTCHRLAADMASCVPGVLESYKRLIDDGMGMSLADALAMESERAHASAAATHAADIASRREGVVDRGRSKSV
ncbi:MAG: enoyl-CoA hydratase [Deltaproteobacteria bacterium]|jgi:enoyl-CoA hydratase|nr:enoyl-CoA hydratase [Deltaproteobacteria bacterium]MBW2696151.1 enoyl-CoA hydratase [Deltaproteobacteria bacterium]